VAAALVACGKGFPSGSSADDGGAGGASPPAGSAAAQASGLPPTATVVAPPPAPLPSDLKPAPLSFAPIARQADPSVVTITTVGEQTEASPFAGRPRVRELQGLGTGFIVEKDGVILTNNHVIEDAEEITVKLADARTFPARVKGRDKSTDIAVVQIDAQALTPLPLGDSDGIEIGDWVIAIGNPFGLQHTVSAGIISAKGRTRDDVPLGDPTGYYDFLQTDASINPGNSGGPLLNLRGEVVGINTAIRGGGAQGIGFAIPINMVKQLLPMLLRDGHITRSALGVRIRDLRELSPEEKAQLVLKDDKGNAVANGAVLESVLPGGPAEKAGMQPGDIIVSFEGQAIDKSKQLQWLASTFGVGKTATLGVMRGGKPLTVRVVLGELAAASAPQRQQRQSLPPGFGPP
jgi:serine protease Do